MRRDRSRATSCVDFIFRNPRVGRRFRSSRLRTTKSMIAHAQSEPPKRKIAAHCTPWPVIGLLHTTARPEIIDTAPNAGRGDPRHISLRSFFSIEMVICQTSAGRQRNRLRAGGFNPRAGKPSPLPPVHKSKGPAGVAPAGLCRPRIRSILPNKIHCRDSRRPSTEIRRPWSSQCAKNGNWWTH